MKNNEPIKTYKRALVLLRENQISQACLVFARIAGWNFAFAESPAMAMVVWNLFLPKSLRVNIDAFEDKGQTPDHLTQDQKSEIKILEGIPNDPKHKDFQPFYEWGLPRPNQSPIEMEQIFKMREAKEEYFRKYHPTRTMKAQRYWGD